MNIVKHGRLAEWSIALVLKTSTGRPVEGSNPSPSATITPIQQTQGNSMSAPISWDDAAQTRQVTVDSLIDVLIDTGINMFDDGGHAEFVAATLMAKYIITPHPADTDTEVTL